MNIYYWLIEALITLKINDLSEITDWVIILSELISGLKGSKITSESVDLYNIPCECDLRVDI